MRPILFLLLVLGTWAPADAVAGTKPPPMDPLMFWGEEYSAEEALKLAATNAGMANRLGQLFENGRDQSEEEKQALETAVLSAHVVAGNAETVVLEDREHRGVDLEEAVRWYEHAFELARSGADPDPKEFGAAAKLSLARLQPQRAAEHVQAALKRYPVNTELLWARYEQLPAKEKPALLKALAAAVPKGGGGRAAKHELALAYSGTHADPAVNKALKQDLALAERYESEVLRQTVVSVGTPEPSDLLLALRVGGAAGPDAVAPATQALKTRLDSIRTGRDLEVLANYLDAVDKTADRELRLGSLRGTGAMAFGNADMGMQALDHFAAAGRKDMCGAVAMQLYQADGLKSPLGGVLKLTPAQKKKVRAVWAQYVDAMEKATGQRFPDNQRPPKD